MGIKNLNKFLKPHIFKFMTFKTILNKKIDNIDIELLFNQLNSSATFSMLNESMAYIYVTEGLGSMFTREGTFNVTCFICKFFCAYNSVVGKIAISIFLPIRIGFVPIRRSEGYRHFIKRLQIP